MIVNRPDCLGILLNKANNVAVLESEKTTIGGDDLRRIPGRYERDG